MAAANVRHWTVHIYVGEADDEAYAEAALCDDQGNRARGRGRAPRSEPATDGRSDYLAVASALEHLKQHLRTNAAQDGRPSTRDTAGEDRSR